MEEQTLRSALVIIVVITLCVACLGVMFGVWNRTAPKRALERTDLRVAELDGRLDKIEDRVVELESHVKHLPTKDDVHNIDRGLIHLTGIVEQHGERSMAVLRSVDRIESFLFNQSPPPLAAPSMTTPSRESA
ncbi:DUF2730 family protein [Hansschlegelia zhihuaiae]|uniref:DUF2730 family protein n=1 Tax=Hansschlegelia zhihuaiae TaxID=405005 RepID=A0A4Q0MMK4_9HYPH|nr:DUF2730 family protein [Hansschlegelia zhihuaiae]RXF75067.1 DUF2730 family protein [Hansschlegelia zhihuaiae]